MFKKILKIVGFVLLGFVLVIGGVLGFMAIRGDFKEKDIYPKLLKFSYADSQEVVDNSKPIELLFDVRENRDEIYSFTILAEPIDVNQLACTVEPNYPSMVTFKDWVNGEWVDYKSNTFYINKPIYFALNNVDESNVDDYYDGVLRFKVVDSSSMLSQTLAFEIDRTVTSIAFKDIGRPENNKITNGLFEIDKDENGKYDEDAIQYLEAIQGEDYPLEIITAPLKANKPFSSVDAKITEVYYMDNNVPKMVVYDEDEDKVVLNYYTNKEEVEDCKFLTFDKINQRFVFNSNNSGTFEFKLATYATYEIQEQILAMAEKDKLSYIDRLNLNNSNSLYTMLTKTVQFTVSGTDAQNIEFMGNAYSIGLNLLKNNTVLVNNSADIESQNLGLVLTKAITGTVITGRYGELKFVDETSYKTAIDWSFKLAKTTINSENKPELDRDSMHNVKYLDKRLEISLSYEDDIPKAQIRNLPNVADGEYRVALTKNNNNYILNLNSIIEGGVTIQIELTADTITGKFLTMTPDKKMDGLAKIVVSGGGEYYVNTLDAGKMILDEVYADETCSFKFLNSGMYLAIIRNKKLINNYFNYEVSKGGTEINLTPLKSDLADMDKGDIEIYAAVVNADGSCFYTDTPRKIIVEKIDTKVAFAKNGQLDLNVKITESELIYQSEDVADLVWQQTGDMGSYSEIVLFVKNPYIYTKLLEQQVPTDVKGLYIYNTKTSKYEEIMESSGPISGTEYYIRSTNIEIVDKVKIGSEENFMYLVGYVDDNGNFVNQVKLAGTGKNQDVKLYPVVLETPYDDYNERLLTSEEFITQLLEKATSYDLSCQLKDSFITLNSYYDIGLSLTGAIGGTYFSTVNGNIKNDVYSVIPGHKDIKLNWNGTAGTEISGCYCGLSLTFSHPNVSLFASDWFEDVKLVATRYDVNNKPVGNINNDKIEISIDKYTINEGDFEAKYEFKVGSDLILQDGEYVKFEWKYKGATVATSPKLDILSRKLTGYVLDLYDSSKHQVSNVKFQIEVGYTNGITYQIKAVDANDYAVYTRDGDSVALTNANEIFKLVSEGGWIKPEPFYATDADIVVSTQEFASVLWDDVSKSIKFAQKGDGGEFIVSNTSGNVTLSIQTKVVVGEGFKFTLADLGTTINGEEIKKYTVTEKTTTYTIPANSYCYDETDLTSELKISIDDFDVGAFAGNYKISDDGLSIVRNDNPENVLLSITKVDNTWSITRTNLNEIGVTLNIVTVLGNYSLEIKFESPYTLRKNYNNKTDTIYSGTTFILATDDLSKNPDVLWEFKLNSTDTSDDNSTDTSDDINIYIKYNKYICGTNNVTSDKGVWKFTVGPVNEFIQAEFEVYYQEVGNEAKLIDTIYLNIAPNMFFKDKIADVYTLKETETKDLSTFAVYSYPTTKQDNTTIAYDTYDLSKLTENNKVTNLKYEVTTYTDKACSQPNATQIANEENGILKIINPISIAGTYYVQVVVKNSDKTITIGSIKFEVTTQTNVVGEDIDITSNGVIYKAQPNNKLTLDQLKDYFKLSKQGVIDAASSLTDVFWLDYVDNNLEVVYKYKNVTLTQQGNTLTYRQNNGSESSKYTLIEQPLYLTKGNVEYYVRIFKNESGEYIALAIDRDSGKKLFEAELGEDNQYKLKDTPINCGGLSSLEFKYNDYALPNNNQNLAIEYGAELVFNKVVIINNNKYNINVKPYTIDAELTDVDAGKIYSLHNAGNTTPGADLFYTADDENIADISFTTDVNGYAEITKSGENDANKSIKFKPNGNVYNVDILVKLTYKDGSTYSYNVTFTVKNPVSINIEYPYIVENSTATDPKTYSQYEKFTTTTDVIAKSNDNIEELRKDYINTLGITDIEKIPYDIALVGDTINLANDDLRNFARCSITGSSAGIGDIELVAVSAVYDIYTISNYIICDGVGTITFKSGIINSGFMLFKVYAKNSGEYNADTGEYIAGTGAYTYYLVKVISSASFSSVNNNRATIDKPVIVANDTICSDNTIDKTVIAKSNISEDLIKDDCTNVHLFMVSSNDGNGNRVKLGNKTYIAGEYVTNYTTYIAGQYVPRNAILPISADNKVQTVTVAVVVERTENSVLQLVHVCNVELILKPDVVVEINKDGENSYANEKDADKYIYKTTVNYDRSADNETLELDKFFTVTDTPKGEEPATTKEYKLSNVLFDNTQTDSGNVSFEGEEEIDGKFTVKDTDTDTDDNISLYVKYTDESGTEKKEPIGYIDTTNNSLVLNKAVSEDVNFYLALTYTEKINDGETEPDEPSVASTERASVTIYLQVIINALQISEVTETITVGEYGQNGFSSNFDVTKLLTKTGNYNYQGGYEYYYSTEEETVASGSSGGGYIPFAQSNTVQNIDLKIVLTDVVPAITRYVKIKVLPDINHSFNNGEGDETADAVDLTPSTSLSLVGSTLNVNLTKNQIKISTYLTINVGKYTNIEFSVTSADDSNPVDENLHYFVNDNGEQKIIPFDKPTTESENKTLQFVHSAEERVLRLNVKVYRENNSAYEIRTLYIKLPKTYTLESAYRVDNAMFETRAEGKSLSLAKVDDTSTTPDDNTSPDIDDHFLGTDSSADSTSGIHGSRLGFDLDSDNPDKTTYYGYDDLKTLGLLNEHNPNKLSYVQTDGEGNTFAIVESITFALGGKNETIITISNNAGVNGLEYKFKVEPTNNDSGAFTLNSNLLVSGTTISVPYNELDNLELGYLKYLPTQEDGLVAKVYSVINSENGSTLETGRKIELFKTVAYNGASAEFSSTVSIDSSNNSLAENTTYKISVKIVTINGLAGEYTLVVSDVNISKGYGNTSNAYEKAFAGYEIGKLSDKLPDRPNGATRVTVTINGKPNGKVGNKLEDLLEYKGAYKGHGSYKDVEYGKYDTSLIYYEDEDGVIKSRSVKNDTPVTMVFEVYTTITDSDTGNTTKLLVGRIEYKIMLVNNLEIRYSGGTYNGNAVDLYIGSRAYTKSGDTTTINLLQSGSGDDYNNLYVELYKYSYENGVKTEYLFDAQGELEFFIKDKDKLSWLQGDQKIEIEDEKTGKLTITGNPDGGSFKLLVYSTNGTGYGIEITVNVHKYDSTKALYNSSINMGSGSGLKSGTDIKLFASTGAVVEDSAFNVNRIEYTKEPMVNQTVKHSTKLSSISGDSNLDVKCEMKVFESTDITDISVFKNTEAWKGATKVNIDRTNNTTAILTTLPQVVYSTTNQNGIQVYNPQIVGYRLTVTYNNDSKCYYAFYLVYNDEKIEVNNPYLNNQELTYNTKPDNAPTWTAPTWTTKNSADRSVDRLIIMGANGMYKINTDSSLYKNPSNYEAELIITEPTTTEGGNKIDVTKTAKLTLSKLDNGTTDNALDDSIIGDIEEITKITITTTSDGEPDKSTGNLQTNETFFTTEAKVQFVIKVKESELKQLVSDPNGIYKEDGSLADENTNTKYKYDSVTNANFASGIYVLDVNGDGSLYRRVYMIETVLKDTWTLKANDAIKPKQSVRLDKFFLQSEISDQKYHNANIIGIMKDAPVTPSTQITATDFIDATGATITVKSVEPLDVLTPTDLNGNKYYTLYKVVYEGSTESTICNVEATYYVLVGKDSAMSLKLTQDYVNLTIDDSAMTENEVITNDAKIDLSKYVKLYTYNKDAAIGSNFVENDVTSITLKYKSGTSYTETAPAGISFNNKTITLSDVNKLTSNQSVYVEITTTDSNNNPISRKIELYFNIIINAKKYNAGSEEMAYNKTIVDAITVDAIDGKLTSDKINANRVLKEELLGLIKCNSNDVDMAEIGNYTIEVEIVKSGENISHYSIEYSYDAGYATYTRTLKMSATDPSVQ